MKISESVVRYRLRKMSVQALRAHSLRTRRLKINEVISYDGVENFAVSQYEPNNVNQAIGMKSLFIYDFNFSYLNRKGRMSDRQKLQKEKLEQRLGSFPKESIRHSTSRIIHRLASRCSSANKLCLATDMHYLYRRSINLDVLPKYRIDHQMISSKAPRIYRHILFPVNHADLLLRQQVKAFARETISFSKTHVAMVQKYALFMAWKNYFRPMFTKVQKENPKSNKQTPAMALGLESRPALFRDFFGQRILGSQVLLNEDWQNYTLNQLPGGRAA